MKEVLMIISKGILHGDKLMAIKIKSINIEKL
jgi:hypothetical protein